MPGSTTTGEYFISRGKDGYHNNEEARVWFPADGTLSIAFVDLENGYDKLLVNWREDELDL